MICKWKKLIRFKDKIIFFFQILWMRQTASTLQPFYWLFVTFYLFELDTIRQLDTCHFLCKHKVFSYGNIWLISASGIFLNFYMTGVPKDIYCYSLISSFFSDWAETFFSVRLGPLGPRNGNKKFCRSVSV